MSFRALIVNKAEDGTISQNIEDIETDRLPEADVTVSVEYSTLNYKDGLCLTGNGGLVRNYPHVPGIDFAGATDLGVFGHQIIERRARDPESPGGRFRPESFRFEGRLEILERDFRRPANRIDLSPSALVWGR